MAKAKEIIRHAQNRFCHHSLGTQILIKTVGVEPLGRRITANDHDSMWQKTKQLLLKSPRADLVVYIAATDNRGYAGIAPVSSACAPDNGRVNFNGRQLTFANIKDSINEYGRSASLTGTIVAHEVGHNLGMYHNEQKCGGTINNSIMNAIVPNGQSPVWSRCDKNEFRAHWRAGCLKGKFQLTLRTWIDILLREMSGSNLENQSKPVSCWKKLIN